MNKLLNIGLITVAFSLSANSLFAQEEDVFAEIEQLNKKVNKAINGYEKSRDESARQALSLGKAHIASDNANQLLREFDCHIANKTVEYYKRDITRSEQFIEGLLEALQCDAQDQSCLNQPQNQPTNARIIEERDLVARLQVEIMELEKQGSTCQESK